jgi:hypothetical protein
MNAEMNEWMNEKYEKVNNKPTHDCAWVDKKWSEAIISCTKTHMYEVGMCSAEYWDEVSRWYQPSLIRFPLWPML